MAAEAAGPPWGGRSAETQPLQTPLVCRLPCGQDLSGLDLSGEGGARAPGAPAPGGSALWVHMYSQPSCLMASGGGPREPSHCHCNPVSTPSPSALMVSVP